MNRYIDVENIRTLFNDEYKKTLELIQQGETHLDNLAEGFKEASDIINQLPTADVKEVVRGHWKMDDDDVLGMSFDCSVCGYEQEESMHLKFCPDCGADMRGGGNA